MKKESGLTILEFMVAMFIMTMIYGMLMTFYLSYTESVTDAGERTTARNLAVSALEDQLFAVRNGDEQHGVVHADSFPYLNETYDIRVEQFRITESVSRSDYPQDIQNMQLYFLDSDEAGYWIRAVVEWDGKSTEVKAFATEE